MNSFIVTKRFTVTPHKDGKHCSTGCRFLECFYCKHFGAPLVETADTGRYQRCRACHDYEQKERDRRERVKYLYRAVVNTLDAMCQDSPFKLKVLSESKRLYNEAMGSGECTPLERKGESE